MRLHSVVSTFVALKIGSLRKVFVDRRYQNRVLIITTFPAPMPSPQVVRQQNHKQDSKDNLTHPGARGPVHDEGCRDGEPLEGIALGLGDFRQEDCELPGMFGMGHAFLGHTRNDNENGFDKVRHICGALVARLCEERSTTSIRYNVKGR